MMTIFINTVFEFPTWRKWLSSAHKLFNRPIRHNMHFVKPQPKSSTTKTAIEPETKTDYQPFTWN